MVEFVIKVGSLETNQAIVHLFHFIVAVLDDMILAFLHSFDLLKLFKNIWAHLALLNFKHHRLEPSLNICLVIYNTSIKSHQFCIYMALKVSQLLLYLTNQYLILLGQFHRPLIALSYASLFRTTGPRHESRVDRRRVHFRACVLLGSLLMRDAKLTWVFTRAVDVTRAFLLVLGDVTSSGAATSPRWTVLLLLICLVLLLILIFFICRTFDAIGSHWISFNQIGIRGVRNVLALRAGVLTRRVLREASTSLRLRVLLARLAW